MSRFYRDNIIMENNLKINLDTSEIEESLENATKIVIDALNEINRSILDFEMTGGTFNDTIDVIGNSLGILSSSLSIASLAFQNWSSIVPVITGALGAITSPAGLAVIAVSGLALAFAGVVYAAFNSKSELEELTEAAIKAKEEHIKLREENDKLAESNVKQIDRYSKLKDELDRIVDSNGRVKEGYEERACFITNELSKATDEEIKITDGIIENYNKLSGEIDNLIAKKRAKAILDAHEGDYNDALEHQTEALQDMKKAQKELTNEQKKKQDFLDLYMANTTRYGKSESEMLQEANKSWGIHIKEYKDNLQAQEDKYGEYTKSIRNYEQANGDFLAGHYDNINSTIAGTNEKYAANTEERKKMIQQNVEDELAELNYLNENKNELSDAQYQIEKERIEASILDEKNKMFEISNAAWEGTDAYAEAMAYLSSEGMRAYDENGNLTEAARTKIDQLHLQTLELIPQYSETLMEMANTGQLVFDENGELTSAAQTKLVNTFMKMTELEPQYSDALSAMANNGQAVFDTNGELTTAAQNKMIAVYATLNGLSPEYKSILQNMANEGETVFDSNGNLTKAAKKKIEDAKKAVKENKKGYTTENEKATNEANAAFRKPDYYSAGANFMIGASNGMSANAGALSVIAGGAAQSAISALMNNWVIGSPSKKTRKIGEFFMEGLELGMKDNEKSFVDKVGGIGSQAIKTMRGSLQMMKKQELELLGDTMQGAVFKSNMQIQQGITVVADYESGKAITNKNRDKSILKGKLEAVIENKVFLDDREMAVALAPLISEELAFQ